MKKMLSDSYIPSDDALKFIKDFEDYSHEYLSSKGITGHDYANAYLDLQWKFLHAVLRRQTSTLQHRSSGIKQLQKSS